MAAGDHLRQGAREHRMKVGNDKVGVVKAHREPRVGEDHAGETTNGKEEYKRGVGRG